MIGIVLETGFESRPAVKADALPGLEVRAGNTSSPSTPAICKLLSEFELCRFRRLADSLVPPPMCLPCDYASVLSPILRPSLDAGKLR